MNERGDWRSELSEVAREVLHASEREVDAVAGKLRELIGRRDPVMIQPYRGFGSGRQLWLRGRVLEDESIPPATADAGALANLWAMALRFESDEVPGARVRAEAAGRSVEVVADEEGYFELTLEPDEDPGPGWMDVSLELDEAQHTTPDGRTVRATGRVRVVAPDAAYGVISDIDDTVLPSGATSLWTLARSTMLGNAASRTPFDGVAELYAALERGPADRDARNPMFYVSSSPWNLYDFLVEFLSRNEIPAGPVLLRDLGIDETKLIKGGHGHKLDKIDRIFGAFPDLPFVLLGDSGQEDVELYDAASKRYPGRVLAVYIRDVTGAVRADEIRDRIDVVASRGIDMVLVPDSAAALEHAARVGLVADD